LREICTFSVLFCKKIHLAAWSVPPDGYAYFGVGSKKLEITAAAIMEIVCPMATGPSRDQGAT